MIQRFDRNDRRILDLPAVRPCEGISPATLLDSLIQLSHTIISNYQSKPFATQRKNARETIRQVSILSLLLDEIKEHVPQISDHSIVLCLSELHITFQKIRFLFEDCTREGAKTLILMKSHSISTHFRALIRVIATTLDIFPLNSVEISPEIKELVEMLSKQATRAKVDIDPRDESALRRVILVLNQFENRVEPDPFTTRRILAHLDIRTWADCHKETMFLEEQMRAEHSDGGGEREVPLLSSLLGFLSYCRGVLFDDYDFGFINDHNSVGENSSNFEVLNFLNIDDFRCPISLELMTDPVTVSTGQTYDRVSIQKWLKSGSMLCPKTGEKLKTTDMIPNTNLRKLIQQFCTEYDVSISKSRKNNRDISRTILPGSPANAEAIKFLSEYLALVLGYGTDQQKNKAAYEVRLLAKSNLFNRAHLIESGSVPPLLEMLDSCCNNPMMQENAISALMKLSKHAMGQKSIVENGGLNPIIEVLKNGVNRESRQIAAATIFYLSSAKNYRRIIGEYEGIFPSLLELVKNGTHCGKKNSVVAIFALLFHHKNRVRAIEAGAIPILLNLLEASSDKIELQTDTLAVLSTLADSVDGSVEIMRALSLILRCLYTVETRAGKEYSVSILHSLCLYCGADVLPVLAKDASLMNMLYLLLTEGTSHAGRKSRSLIKILQKYCETRSSRSIGEIRQEQFVNVR